MAGVCGFGWIGLSFGVLRSFVTVKDRRGFWMRLKERKSNGKENYLKISILEKGLRIKGINV